MTPSHGLLHNIVESTSFQVDGPVSGKRIQKLLLQRSFVSGQTKSAPEQMGKPEIDYSLYLVTGRELLPPGKDYYESLEESLKGGVTVVQVREKKADTGEFLQIALRTKEICDKYNVPVIINDRVDIALATKAHGVHLGQSDMPVEVARLLLPSDAIIGVSVGNADEARSAVSAGADYVGIGAVYPTSSKGDAKILGVRGIGPILSILEGTRIKSVAIGGIKSINLLRVLHGGVSPSGKHLDGVAVISEIIATESPQSAAQQLSLLIRSFLIAGPSSYITYHASAGSPDSVESIVSGAADLLKLIKTHTPLVHQITNNVVINQSANATLALGASPIMATSPEEMEDLSKVTGALLVNFGTITSLDGMLAAGRYANYYRKPVVFDPVAVGATKHRRTSADKLLNTWQPTVIKGNAAEIGALLGTKEIESRGVDSVGSGFSDPAEIVRTLARRERCVVVLTGVDDYVSDGTVVVKLSNGLSLLGNITGSGCMVGTVVATFCAAASVAANTGRLPETPEDGKLVRGAILAAAVGGVLAVTIAAEKAAKIENIQGPGSFVPSLIDALYNLTTSDIRTMAKAELV